MRNPQAGILFVEILHNLERIARSCQATPELLGRSEEPITAINIAGTYRGFSLQEASRGALSNSAAPTTTVTTAADRKPHSMTGIVYPWRVSMHPTCGIYRHAPNKT